VASAANSSAEDSGYENNEGYSFSFFGTSHL